MSGTPIRAVLALAAALLLGASPAVAQQPGAAGERNCTLRLQPTDSTESVSRRVGEQNYVTYLWDGMRWLCGEATMSADSAVRYETRQRLELVGAVHYRDTIRDLRSRRLTYFQVESRVLAEDSVRLRQLETGALLHGPRVEFFNMVRDEGTERTVATERPRMTIPPPGDPDGEPFRVDADTAVFVGEEAAEAFGGVVVRRGRLTARGGYTRFRIRDGSGFLTRSPSVEGESFTLTGDTVRVGFEGSRLRTVRAVSDGHLTGEDVEVRAPHIVVRLQDEQVDELWAHGPGGGEAFSADQRIRGDSLHFAFAGGRLTDLIAVGGAAALQVLPSDSLAADSTAAPDSAAATASADTAAGEGSARTAAADTAGPDSVSAGATPEAHGRGSGSDLDLRRNWIAGDTVRAVFAADAGPDTAMAADPDTATAAGDTARTEIERIVAAVSARSFYRIERDDEEDGGGSAGPDTAPGGAGGGSRDSARTGPERRMGRNYVIGDRITIRFRGGSPLSVRAIRAIGLYLEPTEMPDSLTADTAAADSLPPDSLRPDSLAPDSVPDEATRDTVPPDSSEAGSSPTAAGHRTSRSVPGGGDDGPPEPGRAGTIPRVAGITRTDGMIYE